MVDAGRGDRGDLGFCVIGDPQCGRLYHCDIICAISHHE
jgi:hypothetical protein